MRRRAFLCGSVAMLGAPVVVEAQQLGKVHRIGVPSSGGPEQERFLQTTLRDRLRERGWVEGHNLAVDWRYAEAKYERAPELVNELIRSEAGPASPGRAEHHGAVRQSGP